MTRARTNLARHGARKHPARTYGTSGLQPFPQEIPHEASRRTAADTPAMRHHVPEPETSQERIARVQATAAVQIAQAAAGQPTKWTVINAMAHWLMARVDRLLDQVDQLPPLS